MNCFPLRISRDARQVHYQQESVMGKTLPWSSGAFPLNAGGGGDGPNDGCDHGDYGEESGPDSPDSDSGSSHGDGSQS